jgi:dTMP kinase
MRFKKGKLIVLEGIDGSGKATQAKILLDRLKKEGSAVVSADFPQYGRKSAGLIEEYLSGKYGLPEEVTPYQASVFYACDRYDASFKIREWLEEGKIVIADRYLGSNIGHQGGKIKNKQQRKKFIKWLYDLEYGVFKIPKPDISFILKTDPFLGQEMSRKAGKKKDRKKKAYLKEKRDIHEGDLQHLINAQAAYLDAAKAFPLDFVVVESMKNGKLMAPEEIGKKIWKNIEKLLEKNLPLFGSKKLRKNCAQR